MHGIPFFSRWNCVLAPGDTHEQLDKKIVPSSQSRLILKMWPQVTEMRLNGESTAEPFYGKTAAKIPTTRDIFWFSKSDKDAICLPQWIYCTCYEPNSLVSRASHTFTKWGRVWSNCNHQITVTPECCHERYMLFVEGVVATHSIDTIVRQVVQ